MSRIESFKSTVSTAAFACLTFVLVLGSVQADDPSQPEVSAKDKLIVETVLRLKDFDIESSPPAKAALLRYLRAQAGTDQYFELIGRFKITEIAEDLVEFGLNHSAETNGVRAAELLFALEREQLLLAAIDQEDKTQAVAAVTLIGHAAGAKTRELLLPLVTAKKEPVALRAAAVAGLGRRADGQKGILALVREGKLPEDLHFAAANVLLSSADKSIQSEAAKHLELPATKDSQPLPPIAQLVERRGNAQSGADLFRKSGTCINCHKVRGEGKEVGPDLSEIGSKLSREAMYVSILDPSAAISHNYETYMLLTDDGNTVTGLLISETDEAITLRTVEGIDKTIEQDAVELFKKQTTSLMPQDLQKLLTVDQLVDVVEYTMTLTKSGQ